MSTVQLIVALAFVLPALPPELLHEIFVHLCFLHEPSSRAFASARTCVCLVSHCWHVVALSATSLWRVVRIDELSTVDGLNAFIRCSGNRSLLVAVDIPSAWTANQINVIASVIACTRVLLSTVNRWEALSVRVDNLHLISVLFELLSPHAAPLLRDFGVAAEVYNPDHPLFDSGIVVFQGSWAGLISLRLNGIPIPPAMARALPRLVSLSLHALPVHTWPSHSDFITLLRSPDLRHLSLYDFGVGHYPLGHRVEDLSHIETLDLHLGNADSAGTCHLLTHLSFSALSFLHISVRSLVGLRYLIASGVTFSAPHVRLTDPLYHEHSVLLYSKLRDVATLDLQRCDWTKVDALAPAPSPEPGSTEPRSSPFFVPKFVLPVLSRMYLPAPDWVALATVLNSRAAIGAPALSFLRCLPPPPSVLLSLQGPGSLISTNPICPESISSARLSIVETLDDFDWSLPLLKARALPFATSPDYVS
ncbi:hypothetical protein DFH06DRAFT_1342097 [Mycena polygramma]|nr:hypothetical protein DFH06DRAFT_1342097 [Mycena polygramma]